MVTVGPFTADQQQSNDNPDENVLYAEVAAYQRAFTEMECMARFKRQTQRPPALSAHMQPVMSTAISTQTSAAALGVQYHSTAKMPQKVTKLQSQRLRIRQLNERIVEDFREVN